MVAAYRLKKEKNMVISYKTINQDPSFQTAKKVQNYGHGKQRVGLSAFFYVTKLAQQRQLPTGYPVQIFNLLGNNISFNRLAYFAHFDNHTTILQDHKIERPKDNR